MNISKHPFFENSVRCLFPLAAFSAVLGPAYLVTVLVNQYPFAHPFFNIFEWHAYEMLFGFFLTLIAGFILTAGGHWTGQGPLRGNGLVALFALWFVDKIALFIPMPGPAALLVASLFPAAFIFQLSKLLKGYRQRIPFTALATFLSAGKLAYLAGAYYDSLPLRSFAINITLWVVVMLITIIGGRVTPRFTKNFFKLKEDLTPPKALETSVFIATGLIFLWTLPHGQAWLNAAVLIAAGVLGCVRVGFYRPGMAVRHPILGMLHIGLSVFSLALIYMGLAQVMPALDVGKGSIHFLATGGVTIIASNIMVRASLGHTGREIKLTPTIAAIFACIVIGAVWRAFVPPIWPHLYIPSLHWSMGFWTLGFVLYLIKFIPILTRARIKSEA